MSNSISKPREEWVFDHSSLTITHFTNFSTFEPNRKQRKSKKGPVSVSSQEKETYHLQEVSASELKKIRKERKPIFVYKKLKSLFYCEVPKKFRITDSTLSPHLCAFSDNSICKRMNALPYPDGCKAILDKAKRIESYPWIEEGYQCVNCVENSLHVCTCKHYAQAPSRKSDFKKNLEVFALLEDLYYKE